MLTSIKVFTGNTITAGQPVGITLNKVQGVLEKGVKYSLQFKVINYSPVNTLNYIYVGTQKISDIDISQGTVIDTVDGKEVRLCNVEFTSSSKMTNPVIKIGRNMVSSDTSNTLIYELTDFQLERGYKTDYIPNSNDLQIVKTNLESKINQLADSLQFYVAKNDFDNLGNAVSSALGQIEVSTGEISLKVEQTDIDNAKNELEGSIDKKITDAKAEIKMTTDSISQRVSSTESSVSTINGNVSSLQTRVNTAEQKITDSAIVSTVTNSQTYKDGLTGKVSTNQVISSINQTAEAIKISANKLDLTGELDLQGRFKCWKSNTDKTGNYLHMDGAMMFGYNKTGGSKPVFASGLWTDENMGYFSVGYTNALTTDANGCLWMSPQHGNAGCRLTFSRLVNSTMMTTNLYFQKDGAIDFIQNLRGYNDTDDNYTYRFDSGVSTKALRCNNLRTHNIYPRNTGSHNIGSASMRYKDIFADSLSTTNSQLRLGTITSSGAWHTYGALDINSKDGYVYPDKGTGQLSLGTSGMRFHTIYLVNSPSVSSDERLKTDIHYLDEPMPEEPTIIDGRVERNMKITTKDMYDFVKDDLKLASYRYNLNLERGNTATDYGFIAQDILYTKVGSELIQLEDKGDLNSTLSYNQGNYISTLAGALQEAINKIEVLEKKVQELESKLV